MTLRITPLLALVLAAQGVLADAESHRAAARELIEASGAANLGDQMQDQIRAMFEGSVAQMQVAPERREIVDRYVDRLTNLLTQEVGWDNIENDVIELYVSIYTEEELRGLVEFYRSPLGQKMTSKMPEIMQASMELTQRHLREVMPKIQRLSEEMVQELRQTP